MQNNQIKLKNVRLSFPSLFEAKSFTGSDGKPTPPKYQAVFILDKKQHASVIEQIEKQTDKVAKDFFEGKLPKLKSRPIRDGEEKEDKDGYGSDIVFISASSKNRPQVVDRNPSIPLVAADNRPYAGCYVNAVISLWAYNHKLGGKGVSTNLLAVQFYKDGEPFGEKVDAEEAFDSYEGEGDNDVDNDVDPLA